SYTFTLINPLDDTGPNGDAITLDLSSLIRASDFDGDSVLLTAGEFTITVADDAPVLTGSASTGATDEGGLRFGIPILTAGDFFGSGNDHGATTASGSLAGLVSFGADGPQSATVSVTTGIFHHTTTTQTIADGFQFVSESAAATWLTSLNLTSHGQAINFADIDTSKSTDGTTVTETETLTA